MDFQSRLRELKELNKSKANGGNVASNGSVNQPINNFVVHFQQTDLHVPIVHVNSKFDLIDIAA
jgi:hypothetical protein